MRGTLDEAVFHAKREFVQHVMKRDNVIAFRSDSLVRAPAYLVERVTSRIAARIASGDAFVVTDPAYRPRNPNSRSFIKSWRASWKPSGRPNGMAHGRPGFIEKEFRSFLDCGVLVRAFFGLRGAPAGWIASWRSPASPEGFARRAEGDAWRIRQRIWWTTSFRMSRSANGRFPPYALRYRVVSPTTCRPACFQDRSSHCPAR
jgi:hypothetical protein